MVQLKEIMKKAILHKGYALVDILHPCVAFNKVNNFVWYKKNTYTIDETHDPTDFNKAMEIARNTEVFGLGVLYQVTDNTTFEESLPVYLEDKTPVIQRKRDISMVNELLLS